VNAELIRALGVFAEPPTAETGRLATLLGLGTPPTREEYTDLFVFNVYPYASVYLSPEGLMGGEARDRAAGFWRALGEIPPAEADHLTALLGLHASLVESAAQERDGARRAALERARTALLWEHLLSWTPLFAWKVRDLARGAYQHWAALLAETLRTEAERTPPPPGLPLHLRAGSDGMRASWRREDLPALASSPVRSGLVMARADLARAAREIGVPLRAGERRFVLTALLDAAPRPIVEWLAGEAATWAGRHAAAESWLGDVARWWHGRATATEATLRQLLNEGIAHAGHARSAAH
jgi:TorA maturation chaperone TorD